MTATDNVTLDDLANQIANGTVDIQAPLERPRSNAENRREIAQSYTKEKALAALMQMAADGQIKPRAAGEPTLILANKNSLITSKDRDIAIRSLRVAVDWDAALLAQEKARRAAGRYTIEEAAKELASNTNVNVDRWLDILLQEIKREKLPLKNPLNIKDDLPFAVPAELDFVLALAQVTKTDLNILLENNPAWKIAYRFRTADHVQATSETRVPISLQQENAVINKIRELGIDPLAFPKNAPGMPGRKADVRDTILKSTSHLFVSENVFNTTWDRLRAARRIVDAAPATVGIPKN